MPRRLTRAFYDRDPGEVARDLLGCTVSHAGVTVRLTEVEAYAGERDPGSHAYRGRTPRVEVMYGPPGRLYVYFTYGMHYCVNLSCLPDGTAAAVLLRAGEVVEGVDLARTRRPGARDRDLARGPARLTRALALGPEQRGLDTCAPGAPLVVRAPGAPVDPARVVTGPRVGVSGPGGDGTAYPWRFHLEGEASVSPYRPGRVR